MHQLVSWCYRTLYNKAPQTPWFSLLLVLTSCGWVGLSRAALRPVGLAWSVLWVSLPHMCSFWGPGENGQQLPREKLLRAPAKVQRSLLVLSVAEKVGAGI